MSKNIDLGPEHKANLPRTGHSLSHDFAFTATTAHLLPVFHDFLNAGETVTLGFDFLLRTQPLEAAAMSKIKCHTEYFFVPIDLLYQPFSDWYYGIRNQFSSTFASGDLMTNVKLPLLNLLTVQKNLYSVRTVSYLQRAGQDIKAGESVARSSYRLFEMLGIPAFTIANNSNNSQLAQVFPYPILAYNCIYQYYYRLDSRERFAPQSFNLDSYYNSVNVDAQKFCAYCLLHRRPYDSDYFKDIQVSPIVDVLNLKEKNLLSVADTFLSRYGFLDSGSIGDDLGSTLAEGSPFDRHDPSSYIQTQFGMGKSIDQVDDNYYVANGLDIGTANIRAMFASEKLWSITGRARKNYDDQTLAHFGYKPVHDPKHSISCFGHDVTEINIGEVISTANTGQDGSPLGEIAGKGYGAQGSKRHKFTAPCHGVVMAIFSIVPSVYYEGTFGKFNKFSQREDLYTPEYDHLGMQPLFAYESSELASLEEQDPSRILGWQYRYEQWKRRYNRCTSVFSTRYGGSLSSWIHSEQPYFDNVLEDTDELGLPNHPTYDMFLYRPTALNDLFLVQYHDTWSSAYETHPESIYDTDPFVVSSHIDCVKVSTMSDYSLPRLDA